MVQDFFHQQYQGPKSVNNDTSRWRKSIYRMICNGVWGTNPFISKWISGFGHVWASNEPYLGTIILRLPSPMIEMCYPCRYPGSRCNGKDINWRLFWVTPVTLPCCCFFTRRYPLTRVVLWHDLTVSVQIKKHKGVRLLTWRCALLTN